MGKGRRRRLDAGEYWCPECEDIRKPGDGLCDLSGEQVQPGEEGVRPDLVCELCSHVVVDWVPESDVARLEHVRWFNRCVDEGRIGPSPGGAASQLGVSRARVYALVEQQILERSDSPDKDYPCTFISQRSINTRKRHVAEMRKSGNDPEAGGKPWHS